MLEHTQFKISEDSQLKNVKVDQSRDFRSTDTDPAWPQPSMPPSSKGELVATTMLFVLPLAYGGIHLSAWNFEFPTAMESLLWKISGITIASIFVVWVAIRFIVPHDEDQDLNLQIVFFGVSTACRIYIVIEAYISLRAVPIGVYWTPAWIQMIPHV